MDQVDGFECICPKQWVGATCQLGKDSSVWVHGLGAVYVAVAAAAVLRVLGARGGPKPMAALSCPQTPMSVMGSRALMLFLAKT